MVFGRRTRTINRLLIVEDEPLVAFDNEHALSDAGYHVVGTVDSVTAAIACLDKEPVDLVLTDNSLAGERDGVALARHVHPLGIPLVFATASCPVEAPEISIGCLAKPFGAGTLVAALDAIDRKLSGKPAKRLPAGLTLY